MPLFRSRRPNDADPEPRPARRSGIYGVFLLTGILATIALGIWIGRATLPVPLRSVYLWAFATFLFGALVGLSEILSRYRDEPILATVTSSGMSYLALNGTISLVAFAVLRKYPTQIFPALQNDLFLSAVAAGFGAMTIFRSKLFTFKSSDGKEYPIGPSIVLDTVLKMIDSKIDRRRATDRQLKVFNAMFGIDDFVSTANYIEASLLSFQNLSQDDKAQVTSVIDQYRLLTRWPDTLKSLGLGFAFLTIAGEDNFDHVMINLKRYVASQRAVDPPNQGGVNRASAPPAGNPAPPAN
jgi:hypothetical protein